MRVTTSIISPSTAAALLANSSCSGFPAAAMWNIAITMIPAITINVADIVKLTVPSKAIAATVAKQGGKTFHTNMFSTVNTAFEVAVMRLVSIPGNFSKK